MINRSIVLEAKNNLIEQDLLSERINWSPMETVLHEYIKDRRWFRSKARQITSCHIQDIIPIHFGKLLVSVVILKVNFTSGESETYSIPLMITSREYGLNVTAEYPAAVIAQIQIPEAQQTQMCWDAMVDKTFCTFLLNSIGQRRIFKGLSGEIRAFTTRAYGNFSDLPQSALVPKPIKAEQTNTSVIYGNQAILKLFRRIENGINPELEMGRFLTEKTAYANISPLLGALEYHVRGRQVQSMAVLESFIPNQGDAWQYTLNSLGNYFQKVIGNKEIKAPSTSHQHWLSIRREPPSLAIEIFGTYLDSARLLGQRTAELHRALSSMTSDPDFAPESFTTEYQKYLYQSWHRLTSKTFQILEEKRNLYPNEIQKEIEQILKLREAILGQYEIIQTKKIETLRIRSHGDYHLGQVLYTGQDFVIIDFEGEPGRPLSERRVKTSPLQDVAGMLRSFHYAVNSAMNNLNLKNENQEIGSVELHRWAQYWYTWVAATFWKSYLTYTRQSHILPNDPGQLRYLLQAYLLEKATYEIAYELNNRPDWLKVPIRGVLELMEAN